MVRFAAASEARRFSEKIPRHVASDTSHVVKSRTPLFADLLSVHLDSSTFDASAPFCTKSVTLDAESIDVPRFRLLKNLFSNYSTRVRPVKNHRRRINVTYTLQLRTLLDVNEQKQVISINAWMVQSWVDELLSWKPAEYDGMEVIRVPADLLWRPDTYLYNNLDMKRVVSEQVPIAHVIANRDNDTATIYTHFRAKYRATCTMNVKMFPFDRHECVFRFGSWTYERSLLDYISSTPGMTHYEPSTQWDVVNFSYRYYSEKYLYGEYPYMLFTMEIRRKPLYYIINVVIPSTVVTAISLVGFFTPTNSHDERKEKISLAVTTMLSLGMLLVSLSHNMPLTSDCVPLISIFVLTLMFLILTGSLTTVLIMSMFRAAQARQPTNQMLHVLTCFVTLPGLKCFSGVDSEMLRKARVKQDQRKLLLSILRKTALKAKTKEIFRRYVPQKSKPDPEENVEIGKVLKELRRIRGLLKILSHYVTKRGLKGTEWKMTGIGLERLSLWAYCTAVIGAFCTFMILGYTN